MKQKLIFLLNLKKERYSLVEYSKMLIPVRCFTCNKVIGHLWEEYQAKVQRAYQEMSVDEKERIVKFNVSKKDQLKQKTMEGKILDEMGLNKYCCRTILISCVDLTTKI